MTHTTTPSRYKLRALLAGAVSTALLTALTFTAPNAQAEGACPNEQLRSENHSAALPDCRAYEMVTPPFAFGQFSAQGVAASSGGGVLFSNLGAFGEAGDSSASLGPVYLAGRNASGWSSPTLETATAQFQDPEPSNAYEDASSNLSEVLVDRVPSSSPALDKRLYVLRAGAEPVLVGPMLPPAKIAGWTRENAEKGEKAQVGYAGASPDLSHVVFEVFREKGDFLWPGDGTVELRSLYEYVGQGHTGLGGDVPTLIGVDAQGHQITQCGTTLGGPGAAGSKYDEYNAISQMGAPGEPEVTSEEGAKVFFTAAQGGCRGKTESGEPTVGKGPPVAELYAEINARRIVAISEPSKADCVACDTKEAEEVTDVQGRRALKPTFEGASRDGSKVFFLSKQRLLPGAQGVNLYEFNFRARQPDQKVTLIATRMFEIEGGNGVDLSGVARITQDGSRVFFVSQEGAELAANRDTLGRQAEQGKDNLFAYDTVSGNYVFIAELAAADSADWKIEDSGRPAEATPDGRFLLFASANRLTPDAAGTGTQLYRFDAERDQLVRVSTGEGGLNANGNNAGFSTIAAPQNFFALAQPQSLSITDDGSKVFFTSPWALAPGALNDVCVTGGEVEGVCEELALANNVYEWQAGHVYLLSDGKDRATALRGGATSLIGTTPSGSDVFFTTGSPLISADTNSTADIYDARLNGGFPSRVVATGCASDCQTGPVAPPAFAGSASASVTGAGNLPAPPSEAAPARRAAPTQAQTFKKALKLCRANHGRHRRARCEAQARRRYGPSHSAKRTTGGR